MSIYTISGQKQQQQKYTNKLIKKIFKQKI